MVLRLLDLRPHGAQRVRGVDVYQRRITDRHLDDRFGVARDQVPCADIAFERAKFIEKPA
jgi:hypothetical protein